MIPDQQDNDRGNNGAPHAATAKQPPENRLCLNVLDLD